MKNVIDLNRTRIEPSLENYNLVVSEFLNSNKLVHVSIEEIIFDSEKCINNLDKFFDITTRIGNENNISTELGLEAISLCKELNIDLVIKKNLFNKKQYVVSNEEVNVGLIAMIAAAVIAIGVVLKKIWNLLTGNSSGNNSTSGGNVEEKKKAIDTTEKIISTYNATTPTIKTKIVEVDKLIISYAKEIKSNNEITDNLLKFKTIFEYIDSDLRHPSLSGISNTLENFYDSLNGITKAIMFSELDNSFYGKIEEILSDSSTIVKYIAPVINNLDDSVDLIIGVYERLNSTNGITKAQRLLNVDIDKAVELLSNDKINDDSEMNNISNLADKIKSVNISGLEVHDKELNSAVFFNLYGSEGIHKVSNLIYTYQQFLDRTVRQFPSQFDDRFKNINTDLTNFESKYKTLFENNTSEDISNFKEKIDNYFSIVKETVTRLNGIVTSIARAAVLSETILDANNKLFIGMNMHKSAMIEAFTRLAKLILNNNKSSGADGASAMEFVKQLNSLVELMNSTNKKIKDVIGNISDYKDLSDKDVFMKFIKNANVLSGKTYNVSNEQYDVASIEYLPSNEDYTTSKIRHNVNHYNVFDLNSIKVNKMHLGINTTALEEFIKDINLDNEIGIENNAALEAFYKELDIDSISVEQYLDKADKLFDLNNRIISSGAITKEIGLEAISICNDLNINVNKLSLYPSKIGYSVSLEAVGVGIFAMIVAAIAAVVYIAKKVWSAIMGEGSSGSGGGGGGFDTDDVAVEKKITAIETTQEVSQQIVENKVIVEDKIEDVSVALKETISSPEVKEVVKEIEKKKELSPLVKYVLSTNYSNIFDLLNKLPETDIAYGPLVSVVNQLRNLKSFEKEIVLNQVSSDFSNKALSIVHEILKILPNMVDIAKSTGHEYEKMSTILDTIVQKNMTAKDAVQYFKTEYKEDNPSVFNDDHVTSFDYDYGMVKDYLSNTNLDNDELSIASLYACKADPDGYSEFIKELSDMLTKINEHKLFSQLEIGEKTIRYFDEHIDKINSPVLTENGEFKNVFINAAKGHMATFNVIKQYIIIYGKVTLTLEKIIESKLKIDLIIEAYLKAATGQLVELKKRLKSDFSSIDKEHDSDALQKRLSVFYDQIDDLVELSNGCSKDILDIISKDPNYKDIKNSDETFNRFLLRMTNVSKVTTGAVATGNEKYEIILRSRYDILTYSNEAYNAPFIGLIATGLIIFLSVIGAILKKIFGINKGNSSDSKNTEKNITSSSKALAVLSNNTSHAIEFSHFDFNISNLNISTIKKPTTMEDEEYETISQLATEFKKYGDNKIFEFFEYATGYNNEKLTPIAEKIKDKINNLNGLSNSLLSGKLAKTWDEYKKTKEIGITEVSRLVTNIEQLNDITKLLEKDSLTGDDLTAEIKSLVAKQEELTNITEMLTSTNTSVVDMVNSDDENSYTLSTFLPTMEKLIQDKTLSNSIITTYGSTSVLVSNIQQFVDKIEKEKEKISNFNPNVNDIPKEITNQFKEAYQAYIKSTVNLQTALFTLSANIQRILKEYKNIYQMFFTISFDMLRIVFVTLADLKKCNINTATQHQLLHKTVKDFLKVAKDTLDEIEGPLRFDQESTYYVMAKPDIDIWKKIAGGFDKLERDLFNITNKMVR